MVVPRQNNGSDCGVFVCRYAFAMFQLRHKEFSRRDAGLEPLDGDQLRSRRQRGTRTKAFANLITNGNEFDFDVEDIQRIRRDFKTLIKKLHPLYQEVKDNKMKAEKQEKKARRRRRQKATKDLEFQRLSNLSEAHGGVAKSALSDSSSNESCIPRTEEEGATEKYSRMRADGKEKEAANFLKPVRKDNASDFINSKETCTSRAEEGDVAENYERLCSADEALGTYSRDNIALI